MENNVSSIDGKIGVVIIKEGDYFIANSPALDLSSFGKTEKKAISNFKEALGLFIEKKTLSCYLVDKKAANSTKEIFSKSIGLYAFICKIMISNHFPLSFLVLAKIDLIID